MYHFQIRPRPRFGDPSVQSNQWRIQKLWGNNPIIWQDMFPKMHGHESNWTERGSVSVSSDPLDQPMLIVRKMSFKALNSNFFTSVGINVIFQIIAKLKRW